MRLGSAKWAVLCVLVVSGCAQENPKPAPIPAPAQAPVQKAVSASKETAGEGTDLGSSFDNLDVADASLNGKVTVLRVGSEVGQNNLLTVFAGLKNMTAQRLALEAQTIYKDKTGNALNAGSWIAVTLKPHEEREYRSASISEDAVDFLIRIRRTPTVK